MNAVKETLKVAVGVCAGCAITGVYLNQPTLAAGGAVVGLAPALALVKQDEIEKKKQEHLAEKLSILDEKISSLQHLEQQINEIKKENDLMKRQFLTTQDELKKHKKQINTQQTRQRLVVSALHKVQNQQKVMSVKIAGSDKNLTAPLRGRE